MQQLMFVYNADSGLYNALTDMAHKIFSPQTYACNLCALTYSNLGERKQWRVFIEGLKVPAIFLHRDEFLTRFPGDTTALPAVFYLRDQQRELLVSAAQLSACRTLAALQALVHSRLTAAAHPA